MRTALSLCSIPSSSRGNSTAAAEITYSSSIGPRLSAGTNHQRLYDFWASLGSLMCVRAGRGAVFDTATGGLV